jgi:hypothetical protein
MTKCYLCKKRKAKRKCPALGESICSLCCGTLRGKEINCPADCIFLTKHKPYQDKRFIEKRAASEKKKLFPEPDVLQDERLAWLVFNLENTLHEIGRNSQLTDKDILFALSYTREKVEKGKSRLIIPDTRELKKQKNELGEALFQTTETCRYEKRIIIPGEYQHYTKEEKIECLEWIRLNVNYYMGNKLNQRNYLDQLEHRFSRLKNSPQNI